MQFCAGHRVLGHENKCRHLHGHNYVVLVEAEGTLDALGRVIDFSVLKEKVGGWIEHHWDHGVIVFVDDRATRKAIEEWEAQEGQAQKQFSLPVNPTAENLARFLLDVVCPSELHGTGVTVRRVTVWETENCYATAERDVPRQ